VTGPEKKSPAWHGGKRGAFRRRLIYHRRKPERAAESAARQEAIEGFSMPSTDTATITKTETAVDKVNPQSKRVSNPDSTPLRFSDEQLAQIMRCAQPLHPRVRIAFIEAVANELRGKVLGDGVVFRVCREVLRNSTLFDPPTLGPGHTSKWDR
jgi:hypothetical protein